MNIDNNVFKPVLNLVVFENSDGYSPRYYIESRRIVKKMLGPARPLSRNTMKSIAFEFSKDMQSRIFLDDILDDQILYINQAPTKECLIWRCDDGEKELLFSKNTKIPSGRYKIPKTIFMYKGSATFVFAYTDEKLTGKTKLFRFPFPNINEQGIVCMGSANVKFRETISAKKLMREVEKKFFGSEFSHTNFPIKGNTQYMIQRHFESDLPFDTEILVQSKYTLKGLFDAQGY